MPYSNKTSPYIANAFTNNPPTGIITQFLSNLYVTGFIASSGSFGVAVQAFESAGKVFISLYRMYGAIGKLTLTYHTSDGTAVSGVDYTGVSGTVVWAAGDVSFKIITIQILRTSSITSSFFNFFIDGVKVGNALFNTVYIFTGGNYSPFPGPHYTTLASSFQVTIIRDGRGELDFVGTPYSVLRPGGATTVTLQVQRFNAFKGAIGCSFHTTDGTAIAGVAYTALSGALSWADGEGGAKNIVITILNGGAGTQSFTVTIDTPTGGVTIGATPIATVNIVAAAPPPNPVPAGSVPQQLADVILPGIPGSTFEWRKDFINDDVTAFWRQNILLSTILTNKIGSFIGFGGGNDPLDQGPSFNPLKMIQKFQGHIV